MSLLGIRGETTRKLSGIRAKLASAELTLQVQTLVSMSNIYMRFMSHAAAYSSMRNTACVLVYEI